MPPRLSLRPLASACRSSTTQPKAFISSSNGPRAAPQFTNSSASRDLLDVDDSKPVSRAPTVSRFKRDADVAHSMLDRTLRYTKALDAAQEDKVDTLERGKMALKRQELAHYMPRKWNTGDVYGPHDLSPAEQNKWGKPQRPTQDIIDILGINPLDHYKNFSIISEYMTEMGRIKPARMTGLRPVNQRKMAKAIRRAIGMGIHPSTHRHPMILYSLEDLKAFVDIKAKLTRQNPE